MIAAVELRKGMCFERNGQIFTVVDFQHNKHGRGSAVVWVKMKNVQTGAVVEDTFNPTDKFPKVTFYKDINMDNLKTAINTLYYIGTKIFDLYCQMNIYEPSYTRFNIYDDSSIILNDHRSQESFIKIK